MVDKPWGWETTGRTPDDPAALEGHLRQQLGRTKLWPVHQLDRDTSGLVLFVERKPLVAVWAERLKPPLGRKTYLACVRGRWEGPPTTVELAIGTARLPRPRPALEGTPGVHDLRPARSHVRRLALGPDATLVAVEIDTGRTHQVRLHLLALGHPVLGEALHLSPPCTRHPRHALHAWKLRIEAGPGGPVEHWQAPLPPDLLDLCAREGLIPPPD